MHHRLKSEEEQSESEHTGRAAAAAAMMKIFDGGTRSLLDDQLPP